MIVMVLLTPHNSNYSSGKLGSKELNIDYTPLHRVFDESLAYQTYTWDQFYFTEICRE
jgi:hypothetical protein